MAKVIWSPNAREHIRAIHAYISTDSPARADAFIEKILQTATRSGLFPESGRIIPEIDLPSCREVFVGSYRIMYRIVGDAIWITGVIHGARDWSPDEI